MNNSSITMRSLSEIKKLRNRFQLNQKELAKKSGVSQSLIAKIESGKVEPTFSKAQQIFAALEDLREKKEVKAYEVMNKKVLSISMDDYVKKIITIMKQQGISQVPVLHKERVYGNRLPQQPGYYDTPWGRYKKI